jgi:uncharacterized protein YidB (DUF937 family)
MGLLDSVLPGGNLAKPLGIAALALLAYRATHGSSTNNSAELPSGGTSGGLLGGILGGAGGGLLSGILGGANQAGSGMPAAAEQVHEAVPQGLNGLVQRFQQSGFGDVINSWIGTGPNQPMPPNQIHQALGPETVDELSRQSGIPRQDLLSQLSQALPAFVDRLTPSGRIPNQAEMSRWQSGEPIQT